MDTTGLSRNERRRLRTREQLKAAALALILERGYDSFSVQDVTDRADLGRGTFYIHFQDKADIAWAIVKDGIDATSREAYRRFQGEPLPPQIEFFGYLNILRHAEQHRDLYRVMLGSQGSSLLTARVQAYMAADFLQDLQTPGVYQELHAPREVLAQIITGAIIRLIVWWLESSNPYTPEQLAAMLYETLHHRPAPPTAAA